MEREKFGSRLGFILISAGCAIGLGNVWRFPYIVGQYGGAAFILIYLVFLLIFGLPIMTMEFAVGRASGTSIANAFQRLEKKRAKWHWFSWLGIVGNYMLMMFYPTVTGWMFIYFIKMLRGDFFGQSVEVIQNSFTDVIGDPLAMVAFMVIVVVIGALICSLGLQKGVEKITKAMMVALLAIIAVLAVNSILLPGADEGLRYYLVPDFSRMTERGLGEAVFAAMGQAFFTLSIGMGAMTIFGSYIKKERRLFGEALSISLLDTFVALCAGLIIIPACFAYDIPAGQGPSLIFQTLPVVFNHMPGGQIWGTLFFLFMIFAAISTIIAVFENIVSFGMDLRGWSRRKSCAINLIALIVLSLPCALGFNLLSGVQPLGVGSTILDLEDFIISNNILPLGSLVFVLFCTNRKSGWGWGNFIGEANIGRGLKLPAWLGVYCKYIMPLILLFFWIWGIITMF